MIRDKELKKKIAAAGIVFILVVSAVLFLRSVPGYFEVETDPSFQIIRVTPTPIYENDSPLSITGIPPIIFIPVALTLILAVVLFM